VKNKDEVVIPEGECAIVTEGGMTRLSLLVPGVKSLPEDGDIPDLMIALTACMVRLEQDPAFMEEQIKWFMDKDTDQPESIQH
jgi:hypothetical protein